MTNSTMQADAIVQGGLSAVRPPRKSRAMTAAQERVFFLVGAAVVLCAEVLVYLHYGAIVG